MGKTIEGFTEDKFSEVCDSTQKKDLVSEYRALQRMNCGWNRVITLLQYVSLISAISQPSKGNLVSSGLPIFNLHAAQALFTTPSLTVQTNLIQQALTKLCDIHFVCTNCHRNARQARAHHA